MITRTAIGRGFECVGVIDINPSLTGRDAGEVLGTGEMGVEITGDAEAVIKETSPDVVIHATGSYLDRIYPQLSLCARLGVKLVSTCETLVYPYYRYPTLAEQLDEEARNNNATIIGAGVNPGFLFDYLPAVITASCNEVRAITVTRSLDAARRREAFQRKIGVGMDEESWRKAMAEGAITGHVGYAESAALLTEMLGLTLRTVREKQEPILNQGGRAKGLVGTAEAETKEETRITLRFIAAVNQEDYDEIKIEGEPGVTWRSTGTRGDEATAAIILNTANLITKTDPGLKTLKDIPPLRLQK